MYDRYVFSFMWVDISSGNHFVIVMEWRPFQKWGLKNWLTVFDRLLANRKEKGIKNIVTTQLYIMSSFHF